MTLISAQTLINASWRASSTMRTIFCLWWAAVSGGRNPWPTGAWNVARGFDNTCSKNFQNFSHACLIARRLEQYSPGIDWCLCNGCVTNCFFSNTYVSLLWLLLSLFMSSKSRDLYTWYHYTIQQVKRHNAHFPQLIFTCQWKDNARVQKKLTIPSLTMPTPTLLALLSIPSMQTISTEAVQFQKSFHFLKASSGLFPKMNKQVKFEYFLKFRICMCSNSENHRHGTSKETGDTTTQSYRKAKFVQIATWWVYLPGPFHIKNDNFFIPRDTQRKQYTARISSVYMTRKRWRI